MITKQFKHGQAYRSILAACSVTSAFLLFMASAQAAGPSYLDDPFNDGDFIDAPLILDVRNPTRGRAEMALFFASSLIDKYTAHRGVMLDFNYHLFDSLGFGVTAGFMHGQLTNIVTDDAGVIGNKVGECMSSSGEALKCSDDQIQPDLPDYKQITGVLDLTAIWSPIYGKINVVSEFSINIQIYGLLGLGINGTRTVTASVGGVKPTSRSAYTLTNAGFGDAGFFSDPKLNLTGGAGIRVFLAEWVNLRMEVRSIVFRDSFNFDTVDRGAPAVGYNSKHIIGHVGLGFIPF